MMESESTTKDFAQAALEHLDALYGYGLALSRNQAEAEDLVQETYLRATRAFGQLLPDSNLKGWLFAILRNVWLNQIRHAKSGPEFIAFENEAEVAERAASGFFDDPHTSYVRKAERALVRDAIDRLDRHHREVIVLRDLEGFTYQQIASILQCPAGTVMSRLGRARQQLRMLLTPWLPTRF